MTTSDDAYGRFLRAALFEDAQLSLGEKIQTAVVAKAAKLDIATARKCVARLIDEDLGREAEEAPDCFQLDQDRMQFALGELSRERPREQESLAPRNAGQDVASLIQRATDLREMLRQAEQHGGTVVGGDDIAPILGEIDTEALRLIHLHAPWLESKWQASSRKPEGVWRDIDAIAGDLPVGNLLRELRDRIPILEAIERQVNSTMPKHTMTHPALDPIPAMYAHLADGIRRFHDDHPADDSVFIMMKFPEPATMEPWKLQCLEDLYNAVKDELDRHGFVACRADKKTYATSKQLWDNLCIYMLGSRRGVAILEDHIGDEFNPNVALEYGFMRGLGREAILLKERRFKHLRADIAGTIPKDFDIAPADHKVDKLSMQDAVHNWLTDIGIAPKRAR